MKKIERSESELQTKQQMEHTFDGSFKGLGHCNHDVSAKYPEDVIDKKPS